MKWLDKYDAPKAQNGIEGTMSGLTDKGFNYNGAWGGQFKEGGKVSTTQEGTTKKPLNTKPKVMTSKDSVAHQADKILKYEQLKGGPGGTPLPYYSDPQYMDMLMSRIYPEVQKIMPKASAMEAGEAMDFIFNAGWDKVNNKITKDPRAFALQEYYRQYDPSKLDKDGKWSGRKNPAYSFDKEYANTIGKLSENERRLLMNKGRDWYYKNINNPSPGVPSSDYNDTWYGRIWNTNDFQPFNPKNPKFIPIRQEGGEIPVAQNGNKKKPLYVDSRNDPRYEAYSDSLNLYKHTLKAAKNNKNNKLNFVDRNKWSGWSRDINAHNFDKLPVNNPFIQPVKIAIEKRSEDIYGKPGVYPIYKKPEQQVIVQSKPVKITPKGHTVNKKEIKGNSNVRPQAKLPKYFNVTDKVNQLFGGTETQYRSYPDQTLPSISTQKYPDGTPMNTRKMVPVYQQGGSMFKDPSIPQVDYSEPTYSYPLRDKLYPGEDEYFKANPHVGGMAAEDNSVIINPYSKLTDEQKEGIRINETARLAMRNGYRRPDFELTPEQQEAFKNYSTNIQDQKETIIGRILSGDTSAGNVTPEQKKYAEQLKKVLNLQNSENTDTEDYNMNRALELGYTPDETGHWPSVDYETGEWLKSKKHPTRGMEIMAYTLNPELQTNLDLIENERGTLQYVPKKQLGGSIPGSVGFTYARTQGIPSEGKYAKKTMPSAQNGVDMYGNPIIANIRRDESVARTNYNPRTNTIMFGSDLPLFLSPEILEKTLAHENRHAWQFANDRTNFNIVHNPEYAFEDRLMKKPEQPSTDEVFENYHNRKAIESDIDVKRFKENNPSFSYVPNQIIYDKIIDDDQYENPESVEGEAEYYQETGQQFQNGGEMKYYQHGLDFKPKGMKNGGWLDSYDVPKAQNGFFDKVKSTLNPYNWGVEDYSKEKNFNKAYASAKKAGEKEFMYKGKRYNTNYAGTPRQEVGAYGADGRPVHNVNLNSPSQVNLYPMFGKYLPGHVAASITSDSDAAAVNYSMTGNYPIGLSKVKNKGEHTYYVYGADKDKFYKKALSLPTGDYRFEDKYTPSDWNLITNNCADNVCDAFGIPRSKGIQTPSGAVSKIKEKHPTLDVTGRTYRDYRDSLLKEKNILNNSKYWLGIASSPDNKELSTQIISKIQKKLVNEGYDLPKSTKQNNYIPLTVLNDSDLYNEDFFDGVYGPETKAALEDWQKKNKKKEGGLIKAQEGKNIRVQNADGTISVMNTDSPEYRAMYKSGMVQHPSAGQGDNPYFGGVLDEVSITRAPREKGFWEQYADKIAEENRDAGVLGAIIGTPISAVMSLPQLAMMKDLTGEMQRPSEAMDIQNPYGTMAVDLVTDPTNYAGAGLIDDIFKVSSKAKNLFRKGYKPIEVPQPSSVSSSVDDVEELGSTLNLRVDNRGLVRKKKDPIWEKKQLDNGLIELTPFRKGINDEIVKKVVIPDKGEIALKYYLDENGKTIYYFSASVPEGGIAAGRAYKHLEQYIPKGAEILEKSSLSTDSFNNILRRLKNNDRFSWTHDGYVPLNSSGVNKKLSNMDNIIKENETFVTFDNAEEAQKALDEINSRITIEGFPKAKIKKNIKGYTPAGGKLQLTTDYEIHVPNIRLTKLYKKGGVIKDDMGQWAHPGEITQINSPYITMQGVPYPVLGISNTGDVQMMYPGGEYEFDGDSVTEYPMAKNGINNLDARPLRRLDDLTNFTNYNSTKKSGWLSKYE